MSKSSKNLWKVLILLFAIPLMFCIFTFVLGSVYWSKYEGFRAQHVINKNNFGQTIDQKPSIDIEDWRFELIENNRGTNPKDLYLVSNKYNKKFPIDYSFYQDTLGNDAKYRLFTKDNRTFLIYVNNAMGGSVTGYVIVMLEITKLPYEVRLIDTRDFTLCDYKFENNELYVTYVDGQCDLWPVLSPKDMFNMPIKKIDFDKEESFRIEAKELVEIQLILD